MHCIRSVTEADLGDLLRMIKELAEYERLAPMVSATEDGLRECLLGERSCAEALIGRCGEEAFGYAVFFPTMSTFLGHRGLFIEDIYVRPPHRGGGLGRRLFDQVAALAAERGCARLEWAVLDWNEPALQFYRLQGARPLQDWTMFRLEGERLAAAADRGRRGDP